MSVNDFFLPNFSFFVSTLESITYFMYLTSSIFPTLSLAEGVSICGVSICFHPMITSQKLTNNNTCSDLVKYASMCSVLQYVIDMSLL